MTGAGRLAAALLVVGAGGGPARGNPADIAGDLYTGHAIVTGTDAREPPAGFARALREVLVKLTAEPALADDAALAGDDAQAESMAEDYAYQDRMSDVRTHDEQGTRDRPYDLTVHFAPERVDAVLRRIGVPVWTERHPVALVVTMLRDGEAVALTADGQSGERPREAALAAGERYGVRVRADLRRRDQGGPDARVGGAAACARADRAPRHAHLDTKSVRLGRRLAFCLARAGFRLGNRWCFVRRGVSRRDSGCGAHDGGTNALIPSGVVRRGDIH